MKFRIHTMGCKVNQAESASMAARLEAAGFLPCGDGEPGLVVLNTCCVTGAAEKEAYRILRRLRREHPGARVVAAGCLAHLAPDRLAAGGLSDLVLGNSWKGELPDLLDLPDGTALVGGGPEGGSPGAARAGGGKGPGAPASPAPAVPRGRTRLFLKIQDGCSRTCAYCVIPSVRGPSRSLPPEAVLAGLRAAMEQGVGETVLTGVHLGSWGSDLRPRSSLPALLDAVESELAPDPGRFRLRLSSLDPGEALPLLPAFHRMPFLAPHLHLPLQAGSERVLKAMGRPAGLRGFREAAEAFAGALPGASVGADLIAGFPGETPEDFAEGCAAVDTLPLSYLHVFPFSGRPGTPAAVMPGQIPLRERARRVSELRRIDRALREAFLARSLGREHLALAEVGVHRGSGRMRVLTGNYLRALLPGGAGPAPGSLLRVRLGPARNPWGLTEAEPCP
ncbi:MAG: MiaB/RimO family radical SAM methylthiotransferase [Deltaproteobacteria bacterium]|jgi:threonylcarbamoyladenosine tRNA methylthiotransferase MtaB|nr:MiaB/RimO family radical SAM methylthiotransferase [Deltaproteobacteria bacterium]